MKIFRIAGTESNFSTRTDAERYRRHNGHLPTSYRDITKANIIETELLGYDADPATCAVAAAKSMPAVCDGATHVDGCNAATAEPPNVETKPAHYAVISRGSVIAVRENKALAVELAAQYLMRQTDDSGVLVNPEASAVYIRPSRERVPVPNTASDPEEAMPPASLYDDAMVRGLVRAAQFLEKYGLTRNNGELWDDACRDALAHARRVGLAPPGSSHVISCQHPVGSSETLCNGSPHVDGCNAAAIRPLTDPPIEVGSVSTGRFDHRTLRRTS